MPTSLSSKIMNLLKAIRDLFRNPSAQQESQKYRYSPTVPQPHGNPTLPRQAIEKKRDAPPVRQQSERLEIPPVEPQRRMGGTYNPNLDARRRPRAQGTTPNPAAVGPRQGSTGEVRKATVGFETITKENNDLKKQVEDLKKQVGDLKKRVEDLKKRVEDLEKARPALTTAEAARLSSGQPAASGTGSPSQGRPAPYHPTPGLQAITRTTHRSLT